MRGRPRLGRPEIRVTCGVEGHSCGFPRRREFCWNFNLGHPPLSRVASHGYGQDCFHDGFRGGVAAGAGRVLPEQ